MDVIEKMIELLARIQYAKEGEDSDHIPVTDPTIRDGFLKIGIMLCVAAEVSEDTLVAFARKYHAQQRRMQDLEDPENLPVRRK